MPSPNPRQELANAIRGRRLGRPLPASEESLDQAAVITVEDVAAREASWRRDTTPTGRSLLDAPVINQRPAGV
jgi:hypothetical protein